MAMGYCKVQQHSGMIGSMGSEMRLNKGNRLCSLNDQQVILEVNTTHYYLDDTTHKQQALVHYLVIKQNKKH
jgi:hypothetical protein